MRLRFLAASVVATLGLGGALSFVETSCSQTPTNVPVHTMQQPKRMDLLCMQVQNSLTGTPIPAVPVTLDHCTPVSPSDTTFGYDMLYHLFAVVTQTLRGELAVVDLTIERVIDTSLALPGINFLPVGRNPTDVVVTPDAQTVFVAAAETNKPAIYAIPSTSLLGDSQNVDEPTQAAEQVALPSWPACALPQAPGRMVVVPTSADGGSGYEIVVVMPGNGTDIPALVGLIDTAPFTNGTIAPGSLAACPIKSVIHLAENRAALPTTWTPGPAWQNGLPYVDAGVDLFATDGGTTQLPLWACPNLAHPPGTPPNVPDASALQLAPVGQAHAAGMATDGRYVWVADQSMPFIHVVDTQAGGALNEIAPLVTTSIVDPTRVVTTSELAISPVTRDYKRYLYAVDAGSGAIMVYDVTDPVNGPRAPLTRPNPELDPLQPPDRIALSAPVATIAFARHDFPFAANPSGPSVTGALCNPNPNANPNDPGVAYRDNGAIAVPLGPGRLRGVFAFATLTNGQVIAIDVDDWDSPCRRPLSLTATSQPGSLAIPQQNSGPSDTDPYDTPDAAVAGTTNADGGLNQSVTGEVFWPVIQPNRVRSQQLEEDDLTGTGGLHAPELVNSPELLVNGSPVAITGQPYPVITAARPEFPGPPPTPAATPPNVLMAWDVPDVHVDQTWNVVYEGILPNFLNVAATIGVAPDGTSMTFSMPSAFFCGRGVEDHQLGLQRYQAMLAEDARLPKPMDTKTYIPVLFDQRVGDYVQITDDIAGAADAGPGVPLDDKWWEENPSCWGGITFNNVDLSVDDPKGTGDQTVALTRQAMCIDKFGAFGAEQNPQRDFPILQAFDDHLVLGRYLYRDPSNRLTNGRIIAPPDTTPQVDFQLAQCCFHQNAHFNVRTGGEWVALGANNLYLHHVVPDPATNMCVQSCDSRYVLLNSRTPELSVGSVADATTLSLQQSPTRNSPFAMRNPALSFFLAAPVVTGALAATNYSISIRDDAWQFMTRGQYFPQGISLTATNTAILPQSSMFIAPLGALGIIDGASQGLFVIDLNTMSVSGGSPFY